MVSSSRVAVRAMGIAGGPAMPKSVDANLRFCAGDYSPGSGAQVACGARAVKAPQGKWNTQANDTLSGERSGMVSMSGAMACHQRRMTGRSGRASIV